MLDLIVRHRTSLETRNSCRPGGGTAWPLATATGARRLPRPRRRRSSPTTPSSTANRYTPWFATGDATRGEVRHLTVQFSVFSHLFVEAQLRKVINAADLETYRAGKEILLNELGVVFNAGGRPAPADGTDPDLVATEGTVDGGRFRFGAAHFEWLLRFAAPLGLGFDDLGKRRHGTAADAALLRRAARGLRRRGRRRPPRARATRWSTGPPPGSGRSSSPACEAFKARECADLPLAFWTWHDKVEDQHAAHTDDELAEAYAQPWFDEDRFLAGAARMLDGVQVVLGRALGRPPRRGSSDDAVDAGQAPRPRHPRRHRPPRVVGGQRPGLRRLPRLAFGFDLVAYAGPETGRRDRVELPARAGPRAVHGLRRARTPTARSPTTSARHGDGIRDICFLVDDVDRRLRRRPGPGRRRPSAAPANDEDADGVVHHAAIRAYGDTVHTFLDRSALPRARSRPQFEPTDLRPPGRPRGRASPGFDHVVANVEQGHLERVGRLLRAGPRLRRSSPTSTTTRSPPSTRP